jgi:hypothetical protein
MLGIYLWVIVIDVFSVIIGVISCVICGGIVILFNVHGHFGKTIAIYKFAVGIISSGHRSFYFVWIQTETTVVDLLRHFGLIFLENIFHKAGIS